MAGWKWRGWTLGVLAIGTGLGLGTIRAFAGPGDPPVLEGPSAGSDPSPIPESVGPVHDAVRPAGNRAGLVRAPKPPPAPIAERPGTDRPGPRDRWVGGYWTWDPARDDFAWVSGTWLVPPRDAIWVEGRWMRDADGWYRTPGVWSPRRSGMLAASGIDPPAWRTTGPPADHPDDTPGPAPGPDAFHVPGHYAPDGGRLTWTPGFWARARPGWDWVPSRWVRRPDGWDFRDGSWTRDPASPDDRRPAVARPAPPDPSGLPPAIVDSGPAGPETARDPIAEAEAVPPPPVVNPPVVVVPSPVAPPVIYGPGLRGRMIRPPGYPYGPQGVIVPAITPPFVQRLMNRVLP